MDRFRPKMEKRTKKGAIMKKIIRKKRTSKTIIGRPPAVKIKGITYTQQSFYVGKKKVNVGGRVK